MSRFGWGSSIAVLSLLAGTSLWAQDAMVALRDEATVQGETIRLSDLLSSDATYATRLAAENIALGRAAEPGSLRLFCGEELRRAVGGEIAVKFPALVVVRSVGWPLRDLSLRQALRESEAGRRYDFSRARLVPSKDFSTRTFDPQLEVLAIREDTDPRKLSARLRCQQRSDCGGFSPTVGIIGAILGLIQVMQHLDKIDEVGRGIAVAFVATIYGVAAANLLFLPAAGKLRIRLREEQIRHEMMLEGVVSILEGMNPHMLRNQLGGFLVETEVKSREARTTEIKAAQEEEFVP